MHRRTGRQPEDPVQSIYRIMRIPEVVALLGISRTTLWRLRCRGEFPQPIRVSCGVVGWCADDVYDWIEERGWCPTPARVGRRTAPAEEHAAK